MSPKARKRITIVGVTVALVGMTGWVILHPRHHDPYTFLKSHPLLDVGVVRPGSFPPTEYRVYCWHQPWKEVALAAKDDLPKFGLKLRSKNGAKWTGDIVDGGLCGESSDIRVDIAPGNNPSIVGQLKDTDKDPEWTTVVVSSYLDESWVNVVRYTFFGLHSP